ncbi:MAG: M43 family zinc metalloprotease, partial [Candidatus Uhrbacteria bacterium]
IRVVVLCGFVAAGGTFTYVDDKDQGGDDDAVESEGLAEALQRFGIDPEETDLDRLVGEEPSGFYDRYPDEGPELFEDALPMTDTRLEELYSDAHVGGGGAAAVVAQRSLEDTCGQSLPAIARCYNRTSEYRSCHSDSTHPDPDELKVSIAFMMTHCPDEGMHVCTWPLRGGHTQQFTTDWCVCPWDAMYLVWGQVRQFKFEPYCIDFELLHKDENVARSYYIIDDANFADIDVATGEFGRLAQWRPDPRYIGVPLYFVRSMTNGSSSYAGASYYPTESSYIVAISRDGRGMNVGTIAHELGHAFGLMHTFGDTSVGVPQQACTGGNCRCQGDLMCDTPSDHRCRSTRNSTHTPPTCTVNCSDSACSPDPTNNMSYYGCKSHFTAEQWSAMTCWVKEEQGRFYRP